MQGIYVELEGLQALAGVVGEASKEKLKVKKNKKIKKKEKKMQAFPHQVHRRQIVGLRSFLQPCAALGLELQKFEHRVRIANHARFKTFVENTGLESTQRLPGSIFCGVLGFIRFGFLSVMCQMVYVLEDLRVNWKRLIYCNLLVCGTFNHRNLSNQLTPHPTDYCNRKHDYAEPGSCSRTGRTWVLFDSGINEKLPFIWLDQSIYSTCGHWFRKGCHRRLSFTHPGTSYPGQDKLTMCYCGE